MEAIDAWLGFNQKDEGEQSQGEEGEPRPSITTCVTWHRASSVLISGHCPTQASF